MTTVYELERTGERPPTIFGQPHTMLAEVAMKAARAAAEDHVRAGRLVPALPANDKSRDK